MTLLEWVVELSVMLDEELNEESTLETALEWFGNLPPEVLDRLNSMGRDNPTLREFLAVGKALFDATAHAGG